MLTDAQVALYREHGYVVVENVLSPDRVAAMQREIDAIVTRASGVSRNDDVYDLEESHRPERPRVRRITKPHVVSPFFWELVHDRKLISILTRLLGPNIRLQNSKLNMKSAGYGAPVEWHQDWAFYPYTNDDGLAVGVFIDDMDADNGPLMMLAGSHRGPLYDHHSNGYFVGGIDLVRSGLDVSQAVRLTAPAGSMSFHHVRMVHGSELNRSGRNRRLLLYEVTAADAWPLAGTFAAYTGLDELNSRIIAGEPCMTPRMKAVPVRIPLPLPPEPTSLYQIQKYGERPYFERYEEHAAAGLSDRRGHRVLTRRWSPTKGGV